MREHFSAALLQSPITVCQFYITTHQDGTDEAHLKDGGAKIEDQGAENKGDAPCAAVDGLGQGSCLSVQMESQI